MISFEKIEELLHSKITENIELGRALKDEFNLQDRLGLRCVEKIQTAFPEAILVGGAALYLHGIRLGRWSFKHTISPSDIDIVSPYYINLCEIDGVKFEGRNPKCPELGSIFSYNNMKIDMWIDPLQRYTMLDVHDFKYKVGTLEDTWMAKLKLGLAGNQKHIDDLHEAMGKTVQRNIDEAMMIDKQKKRYEYIGS